jgi:predicted nuclease of predicted toxin-antitoxin system
MKILLDENLPTKLRFDFGKENEVYTVRAMKWNGKKNGELLELMTSNGFHVFITMDKNLYFQQNVEKFPITVFVLSAENNKHQTIQPFVYKVEQLLKRKLQRGVVEVNL